jgi:hypothetical protein
MTRKFVVATVLVAAAACGPRIQRVDDNKLAGVPAERLGGVNEARKELAMAKAELEKARDGVTESGFRLRIVRAAQRIAEAKAEHAREEFALAKFKNENSAIVKAGEDERASRLAVDRAKADVFVSQAALAVAELTVSEIDRRVTWLEAKHEQERAKVALRYDAGSPNEKSVQLTEYEKTALQAQLAWKEAESKLKQAIVELDNAKQQRAALDTVK